MLVSKMRSRQLERLAKKARRSSDGDRRDALSKRKRSVLMGKIRGKNTKFEKLVMNELRKRGVKFVTHYKGLPGKPDIVHVRKKIAIFLDSDFWHGWRFPAWKNNLSAFWIDKIEMNRHRDRRTTRKLREAGWSVMRVWEHRLARDYEGVIDRLEESLRN